MGLFDNDRRSSYLWEWLRLTMVVGGDLFSWLNGHTLAGLPTILPLTHMYAHLGPMWYPVIQACNVASLLCVTFVLLQRPVRKSVASFTRGAASSPSPSSVSPLRRQPIK